MMKKAMVFLALGSEIGFLVMGAYYLGEWLDSRYHSNGLIFVFLAFALLLGWMGQVIWLVRSLEKDEGES